MTNVINVEVFLTIFDILCGFLTSFTTHRGFPPDDDNNDDIAHGDDDGRDEEEDYSDASHVHLQ